MSCYSAAAACHSIVRSSFVLPLAGRLLRVSYDVTATQLNQILTLFVLCPVTDTSGDFHRFIDHVTVTGLRAGDKVEDA